MEEGRLNILAVLQNPTAAETNCGGFEGVFANTELSEFGLLTRLDRAQEVQASLRAHYPEEPHAECHVWPIWRQRVPAQAAA